MTQSGNLATEAGVCRFNEPNSSSDRIEEIFSSESLSNGICNFQFECKRMIFITTFWPVYLIRSSDLEQIPAVCEFTIICCHNSSHKTLYKHVPLEKENLFFGRMFQSQDCLFH
ncbi:hypothetical protein TNCT_98211 [Trichonephila clavata]|uniref:Uncharacterized protein n=1 Tax=Trichonephila clavata TaxID=2740835 RepID=A0A8X6LB80_TRICU|nr:hypothetical protein TNCT_98211 [Trichonephila clavata]